jgi:hypothetical protein
MEEEEELSPEFIKRFTWLKWECSMPLEEYELTTSTHQFAFEKSIEAEQRWSKLSLDVCHVLVTSDITVVDCEVTKAACDKFLQRLHLKLMPPRKSY